MRKIISKILIILIIFLLLFDFIIASQYRCVYAAGGPTATFVTGITNLAGGLVAIIYTLLKALIVGLTYGVQVLTTVTASAAGLNTDGGFFKNALDTVIDPITPIDIFFNKYKLLDINFFDFEGVKEGTYLYLFRMSIAEWYAIMKLIACAILLVVLIYVGIRMALSTIADDKAKYKKMLADWIVSLLLIFILQYIIIFTIYCNDAIIKALEVAFADSEMSTAVSNSIVGIGLQGIVATGITSFASVLVYVIIVMQTIMFLLAYMKRMVKVGFLIMISPLISITYSIDKMGDGKAQALGNWLKEFVYTILIQPFHCIIYIALVQTAINLVQTGNGLDGSIFQYALFNTAAYNQLAASVLAIMCLKFVNDGEKIVRKIFGFKDKNPTGMAAGAILGLAAIRNAQKIGGATRKGVNTLKSKGQSFKKAFSNDSSKIANKMTNSKFGQAIKKNPQVQALNKATGKVKDKVNNVKGKVNNTKDKVSKKINGAKTSVSSFVAKHGTLQKATNLAKKGGNYMKSKASLSTALGIMGAAMMYSSGTTGALEAIGGGTAIQKGTQEFFGSSNKTQVKETENDTEAEEAKSQIENIDSKMNEAKNGYSEEGKKTIAAYETLKPLEEKQRQIDQKEEEIKKYKESNGIDENNENNESNDSTLNQMQEELNKLKEEKSEMEGREDIKEAKKYIAEHDSEGYLRDATLDNFDEWKAKSQERFDSKEEMTKRFQRYAQKPDTKTLDSIKNDIIGKLMRAKMDSKGSDDTLTVEEMDSVERTAQALMQNISLGVLNKKGFGQQEQQQIIANGLGLDRDGINHLYRGVNDSDKTALDLSSSIAKYESCARQSHNASCIEHAEQYNGTNNAGFVRDNIIEKQMENYRRSKGLK